MKKSLLALAILPMMMITACGGGDDSSYSRKPLTPSSSAPATTSTDASASSGEALSSSEATEPLISNLKEEEYKSFYKYYFAKKNSYTSFKAVTEGETKALFVTQPIESMVIKGEYSYMSNKSESTFAHTDHKSYYHGQKVACIDYDEEQYTACSLDEYLDKYGTYPFEDSIEGYITDEETITKVTVTAKEDGNYTVKLTLDPATSTNNVKIQMKQFGGLANYPKFESVKLTLTLKDDYTPVTIKVEAKYNAKSGIFSSDCTQTLNITYSNWNETIEIPGLNDVKSLID